MKGLRMKWREVAARWSEEIIRTAASLKKHRRGIWLFSSMMFVAVLVVAWAQAEGLREFLILSGAYLAIVVSVYPVGLVFVFVFFRMMTVLLREPGAVAEFLSFFTGLSLFASFVFYWAAVFSIPLVGDEVNRIMSGWLAMDQVERYFTGGEL